MAIKFDKEEWRNVFVKAAMYFKEHPEEIRLAMDAQFLQMKEDFKKHFDAMPRDKQLKLIAKLNELENEDSGE